MVDTGAFTSCYSDVERLDGSVEESSFGHSGSAACSTGLSQEPESLFGKQASGRSEIRVKNTFIQAFLIDEDSDDDDGLPMIAVKTCPSMRMCSSFTTSSSAGDGCSDDSPAHHRSIIHPGVGEPQAALFPGQLAEGLHRPQVVPLESRTPEFSFGSVLHGTGQCKPCAWFWRQQGCDNGSECRHCHLCSAGEFKARKKRVFAARKPCMSPGVVPRR